ncbi:hypothetical protein FACS1894169_16260 [Bacteroidia bacterium]|nr:hypothetical protein FACS1894169_16260 [Bacteroidia bacterium]
MMKKYTFIAEYRGGTYISQYVEENLLNSLKKWGEYLDSSIYLKEDIMQLRQEIKMDEYAPAPVKTIENVWCCSFLSGESFLLLNIIETV